MFKAKPEIIRSTFLGDKFKDEIEKKGLTISEVAEKMNTHHSALSVVLNGKKVGADKFYRRMGKAIGLTNREMEDIFEEADIEEFMYKYSKKLPTDHKMSIKEALNFIKFNANLSEAEKIVLKEIENKN